MNHRTQASISSRYLRGGKHRAPLCAAHQAICLQQLRTRCVRHSRQRIKRTVSGRAPCRSRTTHVGAYHIRRNRRDEHSVRCCFLFAALRTQFSACMLCSQHNAMAHASSASKMAAGSVHRWTLRSRASAPHGAHSVAKPYASAA